MQEILPDFILADLFPSNLVLVEAARSQTVPAPESSLKIPAHPAKWYLGNNGKKITILVNEPGAVFLPEDGLDFLTKILGACKLNMGDVAVVNIAHHPTPITDINSTLKPNTCLLFDVSATEIQLPFTIPNYQVQQYASCNFLMAPSLSIYLGTDNTAKLEKTKLWVSLKKIFNI